MNQTHHLAEQSKIWRPAEMERIDRFEIFRYFEIYNPELLKHVESQIDVDYFPRGNEPYLNEFVDSIKLYIKQKIKG